MQLYQNIWRKDDKWLKLTIPWMQVHGKIRRLIKTDFYGNILYNLYHSMAYLNSSMTWPFSWDKSEYFEICNRMGNLEEFDHFETMWNYFL